MYAVTRIGWSSGGTSRAREGRALGGDMTIVERVLAIELDHKPLAEVLWLKINRSKYFLEDPSLVHVRVGNRVDGGLAPEVDPNHPLPMIPVGH